MVPKWEYKIVKGSKFPSQDVPSIDIWENQLNHEAEEGWELVCVQESSSIKNVLFYFRRPVRPEETDKPIETKVGRRPR